MFVLERNLAYIRFMSPFYEFIDNVFVYALEGNLACTRFLSHCNVVIGNMLVFGLETMLDFFCFAILLLTIWFFTIEGNLARVRFPSPWQCACVCARRKYNMR